MLPGSHSYHDEAGSHFVVYLLLGIRGCYQGLTATMMKQGVISLFIYF